MFFFEQFCFKRQTLAVEGVWVLQLRGHFDVAGWCQFSGLRGAFSSSSRYIAPKSLRTVQFLFICVFFYFIFVCVVCVKIYASFINDSRPHGSTWCRRVEDCDLATGKGHKDFTQSSNRFCVFFDGIFIHHMVSCDVRNTARNVPYTPTSTLHWWMLHDFTISIFAIFFCSATVVRWFCWGALRGLWTFKIVCAPLWERLGYKTCHSPTLGKNRDIRKNKHLPEVCPDHDNHILAAVMATICSPWPWQAAQWIWRSTVLVSKLVEEQHFHQYHWQQYAHNNHNGSVNTLSNKSHQSSFFLFCCFASQPLPKVVWRDWRILNATQKWSRMTEGNGDRMSRQFYW